MPDCGVYIFFLTSAVSFVMGLTTVSHPVLYSLTNKIIIQTERPSTPLIYISHAIF